MGSIKTERYIQKADLPAFFRELADALDNGGSNAIPVPDDFERLKLSVKDAFGQVHIKAKFKPAKYDAHHAVNEPDGTTAKPKYKTLKKRMKESFKMIVQLSHNGQMPPEAAVHSFLEDSRLMVSYPGYGDEFYPEYTAACETFEKAYRAADVDALRAAADELAALKGRCHGKYD
jgi:XXXCH domain-containing protein